MRLEEGDYGHRLVLSKRNLLALLHKVDWPEGQRTLVNHDCEVVVENDELHYAHPSRGDLKGIAGPMHPLTETFIAEKDKK